MDIAVSMLFPQFPLLTKTLVKIQGIEAKEELVLAPTGPTVSWYMLLLSDGM